MNVKELIEQLSKHDPEAMVVIRGYEDGVDEAIKTEAVQISKFPIVEWYYGKYRIEHQAEPNIKTTSAVYINNGKYF
jgi:hypothetical protein